MVLYARGIITDESFVLRTPSTHYMDHRVDGSFRALPKGLIIYTCTHIHTTWGSDVMSTYNTFEQGKIEDDTAAGRRTFGQTNISAEGDHNDDILLLYE